MKDTDSYFARQMVFERLADATVPAGVTPGWRRSSVPAAWCIATCWKARTARRRN